MTPDYPSEEFHPVMNILKAERDGAIARLAVAERDRDEWKRRAMKAENLIRMYGNIREQLTELLAVLPFR